MEDKHLSSAGNYTDESIRTMEGMKHIRLRPGMCIGGLEKGTDPRHGIYTILKEVIDNSVDEFIMGFGKNIIADVHVETPAFIMKNKRDNNEIEGVKDAEIKPNEEY